MLTKVYTQLNKPAASRESSQMGEGLKGVLPLPEICKTYITMKKTVTVIPKEDPKAI